MCCEYWCVSLCICARTDPRLLRLESCEKCGHLSDFSFQVFIRLWNLVWCFSVTRPSVSPDGFLFSPSLLAILFPMLILLFCQSFAFLKDVAALDVATLLASLSLRWGFIYRFYRQKVWRGYCNCLNSKCGRKISTREVIDEVPPPDIRYIRNFNLLFSCSFSILSLPKDALRFPFLITHLRALLLSKLYHFLNFLSDLPTLLSRQDTLVLQKIETRKERKKFDMNSL